MTRPPTDAEFSEMVRASWPSLYRTAYLLLGDAAEAEDLVQSALTKTYASWSKVRCVDAGPGYARTVMLNTATSWFRRRSWRNERPTEVLPEAATSIDEALRPTLLDALSRLAPRQRAVVVLRFYEDMSVAETAAALAVHEGTVKSQTSQALRRLRALLGDDVVTVASTGGPHD
ncbi:MAG: SigE family RNA polymerase sigma factor [Nocardioides marinisabuli]|uniref:SigE family RNA polymerase sigma factor n=1 Tax=Nocardioides marinisabuli TaxID=419476 RepID=UPI00321B334E